MNRIIIIFVTLFITGILQAQDMRSIFGKMSGNLLLLVDSIQKQDLMDLYDSGKPALIKNNLNDTVWLKNFSNDQIILQINQATTEVCLLPMINESKVVCVINTVCAPICDSRISFYTIDWKPLDTDIFFIPANSQQFIKNNVDKTNIDFIEASQMLDINLMSYQFDTEKLTLTQIYNTPQYLSDEAYKKIKPYLKEEAIVFSWTKTYFKQNQ